jgi:hypothetical protein
MEHSSHTYTSLHTPFVPHEVDAVVPFGTTTTPRIDSEILLTEDDYDADRNDFLTSISSPCPNRGVINPWWQTGLSRHHFAKQRSSKALPVRQKLQFVASTTISAASESAKLPGMLTAPEYAPRHTWTYAQDELLCVIWRWYKRHPANFTKIFNAVTRQSLRMRKVRSRFESYLSLVSLTSPHLLRLT